MSVEWEINTTLDDVMPDRGVVGEIKYTAPYAFYVEFDTVYADTPPNDMYPGIHEWVKREWSNLSQGLKDVARESHGDDASVEELQEAVTWIVIKTIKENGIDGVFFGKRAIEHGKEKADMIANIHAERENPYELMAENIVEVMFEHSQGTIEEEAKSSGELKDSGEWEVREMEDE